MAGSAFSELSDVRIMTDLGLGKVHTHGRWRAKRAVARRDEREARRASRRYNLPLPQPWQETSGLRLRWAGRRGDEAWTLAVMKVDFSKVVALLFVLSLFMVLIMAINNAV